MNLKLDLDWDKLELMRLGCMDTHGLEINPQDSVIFHHLDDDMNDIAEVVEGRKNLLEKINQHNVIEYSPWFYEKIIN